MATNNPHKTMTNETKPEVFGVVWRDLMLGDLSLPKASAAEAIEAARGIRERGAGKVEDVRAVRVPPGSDELETLGEGGGGGGGPELC